MRFTIKSRKLGCEFTFWRRDTDGTSYVYLEAEGRSGTLGQQICYGGGFMGSTISATDGSFESECRRWYRAHIANNDGFI